ncbi:amino acid transporter [Arthrobacter sp. B3I9]|uniref:hypothetical protein n=1 Tax=Arthrobacter sp. B3I9 TaxID=3042270 RepID=UPI00278DB965|nr:hypothetical protein [Arthrobacter sp. B3I9]MDQ0851586.1 amino acid transporter [Arthrobacter sp. B3I9]
MQPLVTPKPGRVPVSTYLLIAAAAAMLIPVFPMTGVSAVLSAAGLVMALREAPGRNRVIAIVLAAVLLVAAVGITLMSLQTGFTEMGPPTVEPR